MVAEIKNIVLVKINVVQQTDADNISQYNSCDAPDAEDNFSFKRSRQQYQYAHINKHKVYTIAHVIYPENRAVFFYHVGKILSSSGIFCP